MYKRGGGDDGELLYLQMNCLCTKPKPKVLRCLGERCNCTYLEDHTATSVYKHRRPYFFETTREYFMCQSVRKRQTMSTTEQCVPIMFGKVGSWVRTLPYNTSAGVFRPGKLFGDRSSARSLRFCSSIYIRRENSCLTSCFYRVVFLIFKYRSGRLKNFNDRIYWPILSVMKKPNEGNSAKNRWHAFFEQPQALSPTFPRAENSRSKHDVAESTNGRA